MRLAAIRGLSFALARRPGAFRSASSQSGRTGLVAMKCGMLPGWDEHGRRMPLTVLQVEDATVVQVRTPETDGYSAVQVGVGAVKPSRAKASLRGHCSKAGVEPKRKLVEFRVSEENLLEPGTPLEVDHFKPGQYVDIAGTSIGKGFAGVMKRHNFKGQPASHGNGQTQRRPGSIGACAQPGRVFKGKKMAGRLGGARVTTQKLLVQDIDTDRGLIFIKGAVPGNKGGYVEIRDTVKFPKEKANFVPLVPYRATQESDGSDTEAAQDATVSAAAQ